MNPARRQRIRWPGRSLEEVPPAICLKMLDNRIDGKPIGDVAPVDAELIETATIEQYEVGGHEFRVLRCWQNCGALSELETTADNKYQVHLVAPSSRSTSQCTQNCS